MARPPDRSSPRRPHASLLALIALAACSRSPDAPKTGEGPPPEPSPQDTYAVGDTGDMVPFAGPAILSETGLYADIATRTLAADVRAWAPAWPLWSDGATKDRYLQLPPGTQIDSTDPDAWSFPVGTKAWKAFTRDGVLVETRYLVKEADGWEMVAYLWRADGTDADAVPAGQADALGTAHDVPARAECLFCHGTTSDMLAGVNGIQLGVGSPTATYDALVAEGQLTAPATTPDVPGVGVVRDALGYLHGNCSSCHNERSFFAEQSPLRFDVAVGLAAPEEAAAYITGIGAPTAHHIEGTHTAIVPGAPEESQVWVRMQLRGLNGMPPLASELIDATGVQTVGDWIGSLPPG